jgi:hypothetical protein
LLKKTGVLFLILITTKLVFCQNESIILHGSLYDKLNFSPLENIKIINQTGKINTYTNNSGFFQINCIKQDTLFFVGIGYDTKTMVINDSILSKAQNLILLLDPEIYELKEVTINGLGTYKDFKRNFLTIKPKDELVIDLGLPEIKPGIPRLLDDNYVKSAGFAIFSPISFLYYNLNEKEKSKRKIYKLMYEAPMTYEIEKKYNRDKVGLWTGLTDFELNEFIVFCDFDRNYLLQATELDIITKTQEKLKEFQVKKSVESSNK